MRTIQAIINGKPVTLPVKRMKSFGGERGESASHDWVPNVSDATSDWPFKRMEATDSIVIPWELAAYEQIQNAINGYTKNARGAKFCYRSSPDGLIVWCKSQRERNE